MANQIDADLASVVVGGGAAGNRGIEHNYAIILRGAGVARREGRITKKTCTRAGSKATETPAVKELSL
jgi:hypothetical protein